MTTPPAKLADFFGMAVGPAEQAELAPRYNIAPTQPVATVLVVTGDRRMRRMRWGLVPHWAKDLLIGSRMINARAETVAEKPSFRRAFRERRCLVLADGFYEWRREGKRKQPMYVARKDREPFAFAGLWETWRPPDGGEAVESCTIITTEANEVVAAFHHRMPVILDAEGVDAWLDEDADEAALLELLRPCPAGLMEAWPVSDVVNSPAHETARCIEPVGEEK